jgi:hypothetical protein
MGLDIAQRQKMAVGGALAAMKRWCQGAAGYFLSGHAQDFPVRYSTVPDSSNVLKGNTRPLPEALWNHRG